jgi:hypothetical protein
VFLEPVVAQALADKVLDAALEDDGIRFEIHEQAAGPPTSANGDGPAVA